MNAQCKNSDAGYTCKCHAGYTGDGNTCTDIDECASDESPCDINAPVPIKREVTSVHVIQVSKAPDMLVMILTSAKTNHATQMATAKTLSDHSNVLVKMDFLVMDSTVLISTNVISVHITATKMPLVLILSVVLPVPARKDTPVM